MLEIIILLLAGLGAGIVTGLVGASAVIIASPLLVVFLKYPPYLAVGIALSIDVFSSLIATFIYKKNHKLNIKPSLILLFFALIAVILGSYISLELPSVLLGVVTGISIASIGLVIFKRDKNEKSSLIKKIDFLKKHKILSLGLIGFIIGIIAGIFGAGGGLTILSALVLILNYNTHEAVGTSVFLMIFIALFGGITHYINLPFSITILAIGSIGGIFGAMASSGLATKLPEKILNKLVGVIIFILGIILILKNIFEFYNINL